MLCLLYQLYKGYDTKAVKDAREADVIAAAFGDLLLADVILTEK